MNTMVPPSTANKVYIDDVVVGNRVPVPKVSINPIPNVPMDESKYNDIECQNGEEELLSSDKDIILKSSSITHSEWIKYFFGCDYPLFTDEISKEFRLYGRASVIPNNFLPISIVYGIQTVCRYGLPGK